MSLNGIQIKDKPELNIDDWEIAFDGQFGFIGIVVEDNQSGAGWSGQKPDLGWITMRPVFTYVSDPQLQRTPDGRVNMGPNMRLVIPIEMMCSDVPERFKPTRRRRIADYDRADKAVFEAAIREAFDNQAKLLAARSGLSLVKEIPKGLPTPGGRLG